MSQALSANLLLAVPLAPLIGCTVAGIFGTAFGGNVIGRRTAHTVTILGVFVVFLISALTLKNVALDGARFNETMYCTRVGSYWGRGGCTPRGSGARPVRTTLGQ